MPLIAEYGLFLAKTLTILLAVVFGALALTVLVGRGRQPRRDRLEVRRLNQHYERLRDAIDSQLLDKKAYRAQRKARAKTRKKGQAQDRPRVFVLDFHGDIRASRVEALREEITALLAVATERDEVVVRLESPGGLVPHYGLAASQLARVRERGIRLTVTVDRMAASGGYLMACVADRLLAAPFAMIGSIGVVAQVPNFHRLLKRHDIDYEMLTAGEYKRTLTTFGEITDKGRDKAKDELEEIHDLFKTFIRRHRADLDVNRVATGEVWLGERALELRLVDAVTTSDDYLLQRSLEAELLLLRFHRHAPLRKRLSLSLENALLGVRRLLAAGN